MGQWRGALKRQDSSGGGGEEEDATALGAADLMPDDSPRRHQALTAATSSARLKQALIACLFLVGLAVCLLSLGSILLLPAFVTDQIAKRLVLRNGSMLLERWAKPNVPMFFKVWVFDVANADEVMRSRTVKPRLVERGPFVFRLKRQKDIVSFAGDNLYYTERKLYHFAPELSCCPLNTSVTIPNIPLAAVVDRALSYQLPLVGRLIPRLINRAIQSLREQVFVRKQVRELLFEGYEVELLRMVSRIGALVGMPQQSQRFALLKGRNDTWRPQEDGVWAINTGQRDRRLFGRVSSWNSYRQLPFWPAAACNQINGSDGTLFPPPIKRQEPLYVFNQELCRTVRLVYQRPSDIRAIRAYRFQLDPLNFAHTMAPSGGLPPLSSSSPSSSSQQQQQQPSSQPTPSTTTNVPRWRPRRQQQQQQQPPAGNVSSAIASELVKAAQAAQERPRSPQNPFVCFCDRKQTHLNGINVCELDGLIDLSRCSKQAQVIFGSAPHFHQADRRLLKPVEGLEPNASRHTTYLDIEPNTGLVLGGKRRVQLNLLLKRNKEVDGFENINDMLLPIVWFEESALIPEESAQKFRSLYTDRIRLANIVLSTLFLAALGLIAVDLRLAAAHYAHCSRLRITGRCKKAVATTLEPSKAAKAPVVDLPVAIAAANRS